MADKLYYNQEEIIFIGIFFLFLLLTFIILFVFPSESSINFHTKRIMEHLNTKEKKPLPKKVDKVAPPPTKRVKETVF